MSAHAWSTHEEDAEEDKQEARPQKLLPHVSLRGGGGGGTTHLLMCVWTGWGPRPHGDTTLTVQELIMPACV